VRWCAFRVGAKSHAPKMLAFFNLKFFQKMKKTSTRESSDGKIEIFCRYIIRKGKKVFPPKGKKVWHFWVKPKQAA